MPTDTFLKLPEEKRKKIIEAGKYEFSRATLNEASIKNIVENAEIARGSFYQYFSSKEDLLSYILEINRETIDKKIDYLSKLAGGDIFKFYICMYDDMSNKCFNSENQEIYRKIFENIKACDDGIYEKIEEHRENKFKIVKKSINKDNLNILKESDIDRIIEILNSIIISSVAMGIKNKDKNKSRKEFLRKIELIQNGLLKND